MLKFKRFIESSERPQSGDKLRAGLPAPPSRKKDLQHSNSRAPELFVVASATLAPPPHPSQSTPSSFASSSYHPVEPWRRRRRYRYSQQGAQLRVKKATVLAIIEYK